MMLDVRCVLDPLEDNGWCHYSTCKCLVREAMVELKAGCLSEVTDMITVSLAKAITLVDHA